jgi:hypothetical protein
MEFQTEDVQRERVVKEVLDLYSASYIPTYIEDTPTITTTPTTTTIVQEGDL